MNLTPVDGDPFAQANEPQLTPVEHDPFQKGAPANPHGNGIVGAAYDLARSFNKGLTFGQYDRLTGMLPGNSYEGEQKKTEASGERAGMAGTAAQIAGSLLPASKIAQGIGAIAQVGSKALPVASRLLMNPYTQATATGSVYGATDAALNGRDIGTEALIGGIGGAGGQALASGITGAVRKAAGLANAKPKVMTADELSAAKNAAYTAAENEGVIYTPQMIKRVTTNAKDDLAELGFEKLNQPRLMPVLNRLDEASADNTTLKGVDVLRKVVRGAYEPGNRESNMMMGKIIGRLDEALANPQAGDILVGDGVKAAATLKNARDLAQRSFKLRDIDNAVEKAVLRAGPSGSGGNIDNLTRGQLRGVFERGQSWTPDERAAFETIIKGTAGQNLMRTAGKLSPTGNGLMTALNIGAAAYNPMMGIASLGGVGAKALADRMTQANVAKLQSIVRAGGSRAATEAPPNALQRLSQSERDRISRALMSLMVGTAAPLAEQP